MSIEHKPSVLCFAFHTKYQGIRDHGIPETTFVTSRHPWQIVQGHVQREKPSRKLLLINDLFRRLGGSVANMTVTDE